MKKNLLRISTFPTKQYPGAGLHPYKISILDNRYEVHYLHPTLEGELLPTLNVKTYQSMSKVTPRPKQSILKQIPFLLQRIGGLLSITIYAGYLIIRYKIDILHIHSPMYIGAAIFARLIGRKSFITYHGSDYWKIRNSYVYRVLAKSISHAFYIGKDMKTGLSAIHGEFNISQVNNGIDYEALKQINRGQNNIATICAVGSLKKEKAFDVLIEALSKLPSPHKTAIAGDGNLKSNLEELAKANHVNVNFMGHQNREKVEELYSKSMVFVLSSRSEGFPKVLLEALRSGCRVVATDVGSVKEVLGESYPYICEPDNPIALSEAIQGIINDNSFDFNEHRENTIRKYSWQKVLEPYQRHLK